MRIVGLIFMLVSLALGASSGILAKQGVASQNAFWKANLGNRAILLTRWWTLILSIGMFLFGMLVLIGVIG